MSTAHQSTLLTMPYGRNSPIPWPPILRFLGILTLLYSAAILGEAVSFAMVLSPLRRSPSIPGTTGQYWFWSIACAVEVAIAASLIWGVVKLLRGASHRLILIGFGTLIALWIIGTTLSLIFQSSLSVYDLLMMSLLAGTERSLFPIATILLLRAYQSR